MEYPLFRIVCPKDEKPRVKANWAPNLRTSVHGCIDNDGKLTTIEEDRANGETFCKFLEAVAVQNSEYQVFMMFIDRATYHRSKRVREHIYELRREGYNFKLIWLPRYSPDLSPIEQLWRPFKRGIHNRIINTKEELRLAVSAEIEVLSMKSKGFLSNYFSILFG